MTVAWDVLDGDTAQVSYPATAIRRAIRVEDLEVRRTTGNAQSIAVTRYGGEVADEDDVDVVGATRTRKPYEGSNAVGRIVGIDPAKARLVIVELVERGVLLVGHVEIANEPRKP